MARVAFPLVLQSPVTGSALVGATATITKHVVGASLGSGAEAEIFTTETESTKVSGNKIVTDNTGRWTQGEGASPAYAQYWIPEGRYDILISGAGLKSVYITRELVTTEGFAGAWTALAYASEVKKATSVVDITPGWRLESSGAVVRLRGAVETGSTAVSSLFTLPTAARPSEELHFPWQFYNPLAPGMEPFELAISITGVVYPTTKSAGRTLRGYVLLNGLTFSVT